MPGTNARQTEEKRRSVKPKYGSLEDIKQKLRKIGVRMGIHASRPANIGEISQRLLRPRASLSASRFTEERFKAFRASNAIAMSDRGPINDIVYTVRGQQCIPSKANVRYSQLAAMDNGSLGAPIPDLYDGCHARDLEKTVRDELHRHIVVEANSIYPILPNFVLHVEGVYEGGLEALHAGAYGARAMHSLRMYIDANTALDNKAYTISATMHKGLGDLGTLTLFAIHPSASREPHRPLDYHCTRLGDYYIMDSIERFREAATALRNAREWAQEERAHLVAAANEVSRNRA